jgi:hypothetical protein
VRGGTGWRDSGDEIGISRKRIDGERNLLRWLIVSLVGEKHPKQNEKIKGFVSQV